MLFRITAAGYVKTACHDISPQFQDGTILCFYYIMKQRENQLKSKYDNKGTLSFPLFEVLKSFSLIVLLLDRASYHDLFFKRKSITFMILIPSSSIGISSIVMIYFG